MVILGLLLIAVAVAFAIGVVIANTDPTTLNIFTLRTDLPMWAVFVAGAVALAVAVIGLGLMKAGVAHSVRKRREVKRLREEHEAARARLEQSRDEDAELRDDVKDREAERDRAERDRVVDVRDAEARGRVEERERTQQMAAVGDEHARNRSEWHAARTTGTSYDVDQHVTREPGSTSVDADGTDGRHLRH